MSISQTSFYGTGGTLRRNANRMFRPARDTDLTKVTRGEFATY